MKKYKRELVIDYLALNEFFSLTTEKAFEILENELSKVSITDVWNDDNSQFLVELLKHQYLGVSNNFLESTLKFSTTQKNFSIVGNENVLIKCQCCGYKTIESFGDYDICPVCFWEDDTTSTDDHYSDVNKMTLGEAKKNFQLFGASSKRRLQFIDKYGKEKYLKE